MKIVINCDANYLVFLLNKFKEEHYYQVSKKDFLLSKNLDLKLFCVTCKKNNHVEVMYNVSHLTITHD